MVWGRRLTDKPDTFLITHGDINAKSLKESAEELGFAIEEGYSDQTIVSVVEIVVTFGNSIKKELELRKVV